MGVGVAETGSHPVEGALELRVGERVDLAAAAADEMVVVLPVLARGLEAGDPVAEVDPRHQAASGEELEDAVDARDADPAAARAQPPVEILRGKATGLFAEVLDDCPPGIAAAEACCT